MRRHINTFLFGALLAVVALVSSASPVLANCDGWAQDGSEHRNAGNGCVYRCAGSSWSGPLRCDGQGNGQFQGAAATTAEQRAAQARAVEQANREAEAKVAQQGTAATAALAAQTADQRSREATRQQAMVEAQRQTDVDIATRLGASAAEIAAIDAKAREAAAFVAQAQGTNRGQSVVGSGAQNAASIAEAGYDAAGELATGNVNVSAGTITGGVTRTSSAATGGGTGGGGAESAIVYTGAGSCDINSVKTDGTCCRGGAVECGSGICNAPGLGWPGTCSNGTVATGANGPQSTADVRIICSQQACNANSCGTLSTAARTTFNNCIESGGTTVVGIGQTVADTCRRQACNGTTTCPLTGQALITYNQCIAPSISTGLQRSCSNQICKADSCSGLTAQQATLFNNCLITGSATPITGSNGPDGTTTGVGREVLASCIEEACGGKTRCDLNADQRAVYNRCIGTNASTEVRNSCGQQVCGSNNCQGLNTEDVNRFNTCMATGRAPAASPRWRISGSSCVSCGTSGGTACAYTSLAQCQAAVVISNAAAQINAAIGQPVRYYLTAQNNCLPCNAQDAQRYSCTYTENTCGGRAGTTQNISPGSLCPISQTCYCPSSGSSIIGGTRCPTDRQANTLATCGSEMVTSPGANRTPCLYQGSQRYQCIPGIEALDGKCDPPAGTNGSSGNSNVGQIITYIDSTGTSRTVTVQATPNTCATGMRGCMVGGNWVCVPRSQYPEGAAFPGDTSNGCVRWENDRTGRGNSSLPVPAQASTAGLSEGQVVDCQIAACGSPRCVVPANKVAVFNTCVSDARSGNSTSQRQADAFCAQPDTPDDAAVPNSNLTCCGNVASSTCIRPLSGDTSGATTTRINPDGLTRSQSTTCMRNACNGVASCVMTEERVTAYNTCADAIRSSNAEVAEATPVDASSNRCRESHGSFTGRSDQNKYCCNGIYSPTSCTAPIDINTSVSNGTLAATGQLPINTYCGTQSERGACARCRNGETYSRGSNLYCSLNTTETESSITGNTACCVVRFENGNASETNSGRASNQCNYPDYRGVCDGRMRTRATTATAATTPFCSTQKVTDCLNIGQQCTPSEDGGVCSGSTVGSVQACSGDSVPQGTGGSHSCRDLASGNTRYECNSGATKVQNSAGVVSCIGLTRNNEQNIVAYGNENCPGQTMVYEAGSYRCPGDAVAVGGRCSTPHGQRIASTDSLFCCNGQVKDGQCASAATTGVFDSANLPDGTWCTTGTFGSCNKCASGVNFVEGDRNYCGRAGTTRIVPALDPNQCSRSTLLQGQSCCAGYTEREIYSGHSLCQRNVTGQAADTVVSGLDVWNSVFGDMPACGDRPTVARGSGNSTACSNGITTNLRSVCNTGFTVYNGACVSEAYYADANTPRYCKVRLDGSNNATEDQLVNQAATDCVNNGQCNYPSYSGICSGRYAEPATRRAYCSVAKVNECTSHGQICSQNVDGGVCVTSTQSVTMPSVARLGRGETCTREAVNSVSGATRCQCVQETATTFVDVGTTCPGQRSETSNTSATQVPLVPGDCTMRSGRANAEQCGTAADGVTLYRCAYGNGQQDPVTYLWVCPDTNGRYALSQTPTVETATPVVETAPATGSNGPQGQLYICGSFIPNCTTTIRQDLCYACGGAGQPVCSGATTTVPWVNHELVTDVCHL